MKRLSILVPAILLLFLGAAPQQPQMPVIDLPSHEPLRLIVTGDAGTGHPHIHDGVTKIVQKVHADAVLLVGDNVYPCGVSSVKDPNWTNATDNFADIAIPIYPILGNHDYGDPSPHHTAFCGHPAPEAQLAATGHIPHWTFPSRTYELRSPLATLLMIDSQPIASAWTTPFLGSQTASEELEVIDTALQQPADGWRFVAGHQTIYSSGPHGNPPDAFTRNYRDALLPLFARYGVDMYLSGHDHDAELMGSLRHRAGDTVYLVSGNGAYSESMKPRDASGEPPTVFPPRVPPPVPVVGFTLLEIWRSHIDVTFYDARGKAWSQRITIKRAE